MFRKSEETEWTRFSRALSGKEKEEQEQAAAQEASTEGSSGVASAPYRGTTPDVNVTVARASRLLAADGEEVESIVGEHTFFDGTYRSENSIRILGTAQGEIESKRSVLIDEKAKVTAKVTANSVTVAGEVNGQIFCNGRVEIKPTGRVIGEIHAGSLIMQEGAFFEGHLKMANKGASEAGAQAASAGKR